MQTVNAHARIIAEARESDLRVLAEAATMPYIAFPRADDGYPGEWMYRQFRHDCRPLMRGWAIQRVEDLSLTLASMRSETDLLDTLTLCAEVECTRPMHAHERRLLSEVVRDLVTVRALERANAADNQAEGGR